MLAQNGIEGYPRCCCKDSPQVSGCVFRIIFWKVSFTMGTPLVIVESPAKARTISRFLGDDFIVKPRLATFGISLGHLISSSRLKSLEPSWVLTENGFKPYYVLPKKPRSSIYVFSVLHQPCISRRMKMRR